MHINLAFQCSLQVFLALSLIFNSIFIYLNLSDRKKTLGNYRYFLLAFSVFNTIYSVVETLIPTHVYGSNYVLIIYLGGGPFYKVERQATFGQLAISIRCGFISLSYGILTINFFYRYFPLFNPSIIDKLTSKPGILFLSTLFFAHGIFWTTICETFLFSTDDARDVAREEFADILNMNISEVPFLNLVFRSPNIWTVYRCWLGISILAMISGTSITLYCVLGYKIFKRLQNAHHISSNTRKLHCQLFRTLAIQTAIPTLVSFLPCMIVWFIPFFGVNMENYGNIAMIALSAFPSIDAIAVILLLPIYRNRLVNKNSSVRVNS